MRQRTITAIFFAAAMLGGVYGGPYTFFLLFLVVTAGSTWELSGLLLNDDSRAHTLRRVVMTALATLFYLIKGGAAMGFSAATTVEPTLWVLSAGMFGLLALMELSLGGKRPFDYLGYYLLPLFYIALPYILLCEIATSPSLEMTQSYLPNRVFGLLLLVWTNDSMAYILGSRIGRTKLFERISPKKTWEGTISGALCTMLIAWGLSFWFPEFTARQWVALAAAAAIFGTLGDLVESMLKRSLGVKDSGNLLPGHGGLLDRFDAFMLALPFYWLTLLWV